MNGAKFIESYYVLTVNKVKDYKGNKLDNPVISYASNDKYEGGMSTNLEIFDDDINHAKHFKDFNEIHEWIKRYKNNPHGCKKYDFSTIMISEVIFKSVEKVKW